MSIALQIISVRFQVFSPINFASIPRCLRRFKLPTGCFNLSFSVIMYLYSGNTAIFHWQYCRYQTCCHTDIGQWLSMYETRAEELVELLAMVQIFIPFNEKVGTQKFHRVKFSTLLYHSHRNCTLILYISCSILKLYSNMHQECRHNLYLLYVNKH